MKRLIMFVLFVVVLAVTLMYYEDPKHFKKEVRKQFKRKVKNFHYLEDLLKF
ncbi:MAG: hypothetical protein ACRCST_12210 [Turicibacter sp.]